MMRVAVAGTNALALLIAYFLKQETSRQLVILSRSVGVVSELHKIATLTETPSICSVPVTSCVHMATYRLTPPRLNRHWRLEVIGCLSSIIGSQARSSTP